MTKLRHGAARALAPSRARHVRRLAMEMAARRSARPRRRTSRGQTLIIFVLAFTVLIGFMGLAIDTVRIYDLYARMQRAAEAGALAGVIYMPTNYTTNLSTSPGDDAVCRAWQETFKNSFGSGCTAGSTIGVNYCPTPVSATEVAVCPVGNDPHKLAVSITESINVIFLSALNVGPINLTVTAIAQYLPPVQIASDPSGQGGTGSWGTFGECNGASASCTGSVRNWAGNINGPGELKEQGDPLVSCEEGPSTGSADPTANQSPEPYTTYTGLPTNHPQNGLASNREPTGCTNPDTANVFSGASVLGGTHSGYAFYANMENATQPAAVWVWNAPFNPSAPKSCNGRQGGQGQTTSYDIYYQYNCSGNSGLPYKYYPGTSCSGSDPYSCTDPNLMFNITYSIYQVDLANPSAGTLKATFVAYPLMTSGCGNGGYLLETSLAMGTIGGCVSTNCANNWCPLGNETGGVGALNWTPFALQPGLDYRVMVVASDYGTPSDFHLGWGGHSYSMKLCPSSGIDQSNVQTCTPPTKAALSGWNLSDALFSFPGNGGNLTQTTEYPLGVIDSSYAARTLDISLYDPGDLLGNKNGVSIYAVAPPIAGVADPCGATSAQLTAAGYDPTVNGNSFVFPNSERTTLLLNNIPALEPTANNDLIYNGLWVDEQITLPANYTAGAWTLCAEAPQLQDSDVVGIRVLALGQSPVHLIQ